MRLVTWNINGLRAFMNKPQGLEFLGAKEFDIICFQEVRCSDFEIFKRFRKKLNSIVAPNIYKYYGFNPSTLPGRAGVAILSRLEPIEIKMDMIKYDDGRIISMEFPDFILINVYCPNSGKNFVNLERRLTRWESKVIKYLNNLTKPLIYTGDLNVAPFDSDRLNVTSSWPGCSIEESLAWRALIEDCNLTDIYRNLHNRKGYTWGIRSSKLRIDFFLCSNDLFDIKKARVYDVVASDHYPLAVELHVRSGQI